MIRVGNYAARKITQLISPKFFKKASAPTSPDTDTVVHIIESAF
jgi:hypothetical protein